MKTLKVKLVGLKPLLLHSNKMADPLNIYKLAITPFTSKRKKTAADHMIISRIEWEAGFYFDDEGYVAMPGENIKQMLWWAAKKNSNGPKIKEGVFIENDFCRIDYGQNGFRVKSQPKTQDDIPNAELDKLFETYFDRRIAGVNRGSSVIRTRPRFNKWSFEFTILYDEEQIDERTLLETIKIAETRICCGDYRPRYGAFEATILK